jgi:hypothetical protein
MFVRINPEHARGSSAFHLEGVEPRIASDIENGLAGQVQWNCLSKRFEFYPRIIAEKVFRRRLDASQTDVVEPRSKSGDPSLDALFI